MKFPFLLVFWDVSDYILFIDTETSGLPKNWNAPYSQKGNWPFIVQVAWVIYTHTGKLIKTENHYIRDSDYEISESAQEIHGIDSEFLREKGKERREVMGLLQHDLLKYVPLVVGHFMLLDYHMLGVGFYRAGIENPVPDLPTFCTMELSATFLSSSHKKHLKLGELYERLFGQPLEKQHDALTDALATAECFLELRKRGDITEKIILEQQEKPKFRLEKPGCALMLLLFLFFILIMYYS